VVRTSPVGGSELALDKVPAGITIVTGAQIDRVATPSLTDVINTYVPGATVNEALGNALPPICSSAGSALRRSTAPRRGLPSIRTACASTRCSAIP
jgi:hypothetical protein